jgi:uncharacterized membrane protein YdfJ with MMPL/SSD domain
MTGRRRIATLVVMRNHDHLPLSPVTAHGRLARAVAAVSGAAARRPRLTAVLWLALIAGLIVAGAMAGTRTLSAAASGTGESARADARLAAAGLRAPAVESILVVSADRARTARAVARIEAGARRLPAVAGVRGPGDAPALSRAGGRTALVQVRLRGDPDTAGDPVAGLQGMVRSVASGVPAVSIHEAGAASAEHAIGQVVSHDLHRAELTSLPITLVILIVAFGAVMAAVVPLLLGLTSVAGALGALGLVSQLAPTGDATASVVLLIGLAVGVDYSLFYIRREREARRDGHGAGVDAASALQAATASVGRAIVVAACTVMIGLGGLLFTGLAVFTSMALGAIVVVAIAMVGSVTVLPATLSMLGDRIDRGRLWNRGGRRRSRRARAESGVWVAVARAVTGHPRAALFSALCVLGALATPALAMRTAAPGEHDLPASSPELVAIRAVERAFPGAPASAEIVVTGHGLGSARARAGLLDLGARAEVVTRGHGAVSVRVALDQRTALVEVPFADRGLTAAARTVAALRRQVDPTAARIMHGARARLTGDAAGSADFSARMSSATPIVLALVLGLAFMLLVAAFGSPWLAVAVVGLNLLSVGAAFGVLVAVFQDGVGQSLLGFTSDGSIVEWLPLFAFVVLFGLSMDYTVLILERVREARLAGADARAAAALALTRTAGTVTSAAAVMIGVFAVFATLSLLEFKQLGIGLAAAIAIDATLVRAIALPAAVSLLGDRMRVPRATRPARSRTAGARPAPAYGAAPGRPAPETTALGS